MSSPHRTRSIVALRLLGVWPGTWKDSPSRKTKRILLAARKCCTCRSQRKAEQGILRPVPVVADLPLDISVRTRRVLVHYRLWGDPIGRRSNCGEMVRVMKVRFPV